MEALIKVFIDRDIFSEVQDGSSVSLVRLRVDADEIMRIPRSPVALVVPLIPVVHIFHK